MVDADEEEGRETRSGTSRRRSGIDSADVVCGAATLAL